jgi:hypothetical protein
MSTSRPEGLETLSIVSINFTSDGAGWAAPSRAPRACFSEGWTIIPASNRALRWSVMRTASSCWLRLNGIPPIGARNNQVESARSL